MRNLFDPSKTKLMVFWSVPPQAAVGKRPAAKGGDGWGFGATPGDPSRSSGGEDMAGLTKWCKVKNELVKQ